MIIKFLKEWRDFKVGDKADALSERTCEELIEAEFAELFEEENRNEREMKNSLNFKYISLNNVQAQLEFHKKEIKRLEEKENLILQEIESLEKVILKDVKKLKRNDKKDKED